MLAEKSDAELLRHSPSNCSHVMQGYDTRVGSALLIHLTKSARAEGRELLADFVATGRNRIMYITYKLMGFEEVSQDGDRSLLTYKGGEKEYPEYLKVECTR